MLALEFQQFKRSSWWVCNQMNVADKNNGQTYFNPITLILFIQ
jgi:hypothetical protein